MDTLSANKENSASINSHPKSPTVKVGPRGSRLAQTDMKVGS